MHSNRSVMRRSEKRRSVEKISREQRRTSRSDLREDEDNCSGEMKKERLLYSYSL